MKKLIFVESMWRLLLWVCCCLSVIMKMCYCCDDLVKFLRIWILCVSYWNYAWCCDFGRIDAVLDCNLLLLSIIPLDVSWCQGICLVPLCSCFAALDYYSWQGVLAALILYISLWCISVWNIPRLLVIWSFQSAHVLCMLISIWAWLFCIYASCLLFSHQQFTNWFFVFFLPFISLPFLCFASSWLLM